MIDIITRVLFIVLLGSLGLNGLQWIKVKNSELDIESIQYKLEDEMLSVKKLQSQLKSHKISCTVTKETLKTYKEYINSLEDKETNLVVKLKTLKTKEAKKDEGSVVDVDSPLPDDFAGMLRESYNGNK